MSIERARAVACLGQVVEQIIAEAVADTREELLTVAQVAERWHCTPRHVYVLIGNGTLPFVNLPAMPGVKPTLRIRRGALDDVARKLEQSRTRRLRAAV